MMHLMVVYQFGIKIKMHIQAELHLIKKKVTELILGRMVLIIPENGVKIK